MALSTSQLRSAWSPACQRALKTVLLHNGAKITIATETIDAWRALDMIMAAYDYGPDPASTGAMNCRRITGGSGYSLHAYGIAADFSWHKNPYRKDGVLVTDMLPGMVAAIKAIRTVTGELVFGWGGDYRRAKDPMHFEVVLSPGSITRGIDWSTVPGTRDPLDPTLLPVLQRPSSGPTVRRLQEALVALGIQLTIDGFFGPATEQAVARFQSGAGLNVDGIVGTRSWTVLLGDDPPKPAPALTPLELQALEPPPVVTAPGKPADPPEDPAVDVDPPGPDAFTVPRPVGMRPAGDGYYVFAADGGVFASLTPFFGSAADLALQGPIIDMVVTPAGDGYWLVGEDGGIFAFGGAPALTPDRDLMAAYVKEGRERAVGATRFEHGLRIVTNQLRTIDLAGP